MKRSSMLSAMLVCGALLFGCSNSVEGEIEGAKNYAQTSEKEQLSELSVANFGVILDELKEDGLLDSKVVGYDPDTQVIVLEATSSYVGEDAYEYTVLPNFDMFIEGELLTDWEVYVYFLDTYYNEYVSDATFYIEFVDRNGDLYGRLKYHDTEAKFERVGN